MPEPHPFIHPIPSDYQHVSYVGKADNDLIPVPFDILRTNEFSALPPDKSAKVAHWSSVSDCSVKVKWGSELASLNQLVV
jgi:hypothetical protein